ncbi:MAG: MarR family transcriptional regulator [Tissierellia bacterium]|nr:MarR family transcriptional regulator [Tissierellia bacterium]
MNSKNNIQNLFISMLEKVSNGKMNILDFGGDMVFYRGEIHMIKRIGDQEGIYSSELAELMGVTRAVVHKTINKLEKRGLIYRIVDKEDKKRKKMYLTDKGKKAYQFHEEYHRENDAEFIKFISSLNSDEEKLIEEFLKQAKNIVDKHF